MRPTRSFATGAAVWLLVVAVGSALVWVVISRAGEGVVSSEAPVSTAPESPGRTSGSSASPLPTPSPSPTGRTPPATDPPEPSPSSSPPPEEPSEDPSDPPDDPPDQQPVRRTWQGQGGLVTVECRGSSASLVSAIPDSGFGVEVDDRGPDRVEVEFEGRGEIDARSRIRSSCVGGAPTFETDLD